MSETDIEPQAFNGLTKEFVEEFWKDQDRKFIACINQLMREQRAQAPMRTWLIDTAENNSK